ncbi:MAG: EamA family transporter, partial [Chloroflexota bacterium]
TTTWIAVGWLSIIGSVGLFTLFLYVVKRWSASATAYAPTGMPLIAAGLGVIMLNQPITVEVMAGGALVIIAVFVGAIYK